MSDQETTPEGGALPSGANASPEATKGSEAGSPPAASPSDTPKAPKSGEQVRIDELTRRLREAERREQRLMRLYEDSVKPTQPQAPQQPEPVKTLKDFNYDERAYIQHMDERGRANATTAALEALRKAESEKAEKEALKSYSKRAAEYAKTVENYDEVAGSSPISDDIAKIVMRMQDGPEVAFYLGNNHDIAAAISELPKELAALELGRIASRLDYERQKATEKPVSRAPEPPPKVAGSDPGNAEKKPSEMTDKQYTKWFREHVRKR